MRQHHTAWGLATPVAWEEDGLEQRLNLYFSADDLDWWISEVRTRDGFKNADWITYQTDFLAAEATRTRATSNSLAAMAESPDR